jgi:flavin reductase (DIM6/NTAB) family NADH-FMN oxidoreductase RutF
MKQKLGVFNALYPLPTTLVGALVGGKPNFITIAHVGVLTLGEPECVSLGINKSHYTNAGIKENKNLSINIPSQDLVQETDYCGLVTGKNTDKAAIFEVFYGELETAPMIAQCPVNMECRLYDVVDFPNHDLFICEIVQTHVDESVMSEGKVDISKIKPLLFDMPRKRYWTLGPDIAGCWNVGLELKRKLEGERK